MEEKNKKKQIIKISAFITSLFVIFLSVTYAFINMTLVGTKRQVITAGNLELQLQEDENNLTIQDALPMYDEVGMIQKAFTFRLVNKTETDTNYVLKLVDITTGQRLDTSIVKYGLTKDGVTSINFLSKLRSSRLGSGKIKGNQTIDYSLRLWIDSSVEENEVIAGKSLSYRIDVEVSQDEVLTQLENTIGEKAFQNENLGEYCKTYNDGIDTFLVGQCQNNYVWYSGKLWRVVLKNNETGAVKLITDNAITSIPYNESGNSSFENSYVDQWLTQEFLPTLHDYEDYLVVDSVWDATLDDKDEPTRPNKVTTINRTVGLLNAYEYYTTYNHSDGLATDLTNYLNNGVYWWTITSYNESRVRSVYFDSGLKSIKSEDGYGVRPSINLKSDIQVLSMLGDGTISNPYRLAGDEQGIVGGATLLSTRYSGEYVKFNNELYRIVTVEDNLIKITAVDKPAELISNQFNSTDGVTSFKDASIKIDLENYYQNNVSEAYKSMIESNTIWYLGTVGVGENYKTSICTTVDDGISSKNCKKTSNIATANIGLPRVGEMFTTQITRNEKYRFWLLTLYNTSRIRIIGENDGLFHYPSNVIYAIRPSMYLKSNVVIAKDNTGDGTYEHPYSIELGA